MLTYCNWTMVASKELQFQVLSDHTSLLSVQEAAARLSPDTNQF